MGALDQGTIICPFWEETTRRQLAGSLVCLSNQLLVSFLSVVMANRSEPKFMESIKLLSMADR